MSGAIHPAALALFLVPALLAWCIVTTAARREAFRVRARTYTIAGIVSALPCLLLFGTLTGLSVLACAPHCDGMTPGVLGLAGIAAAILSAVGGSTGVFVAAERLNRRR